MANGCRTTPQLWSQHPKNVLASLSHGEWLPWLKQQQESGEIGFSQPTASKYMRLAANYNRDSNLEGATSIRAKHQIRTVVRIWKALPASAPCVNRRMMNALLR